MSNIRIIKYVIQGDNNDSVLGRISKKFGYGAYGYRKLYPFNEAIDPEKGGNPNLVKVGQIINIPAFEYVIRDGDSIERLAEATGLTVRDLTICNPELDFSYPGETILIPAALYFNNQEEINKQLVQKKHLTPLQYTIEGGDTLSEIASQYGLTKQELAYFHNAYIDKLSEMGEKTSDDRKIIDYHKIYIGRHIYIPDMTEVDAPEATSSNAQTYTSSHVVHDTSSSYDDRYENPYADGNPPSYANEQQTTVTPDVEPQQSSSYTASTPNTVTDSKESPWFSVGTKAAEEGLKISQKMKPNPIGLGIEIGIAIAPDKNNPYIAPIGDGIGNGALKVFGPEYAPWLLEETHNAAINTKDILDHLGLELPKKILDHSREAHKAVGKEHLHDQFVESILFKGPFDNGR